MMLVLFIIIGVLYVLIWFSIGTTLFPFLYWLTDYEFMLFSFGLIFFGVMILHYVIACYFNLSEYVDSIKGNARLCVLLVMIPNGLLMVGLCYYFDFIYADHYYYEEGEYYHYEGNYIICEEGFSIRNQFGTVVFRTEDKIESIKDDIVYFFDGKMTYSLEKKKYIQP